MTPDLTATRVREVLAYDPDTGVFTWKVRTSNRAHLGAEAGRVGANGYRYLGLDGSLHLAHRLAWLYVHGVWPADMIDHIDGDRLNNRIANLRPADMRRNQQNRKGPQANNRSGLLGVSWSKQARKWHAQISDAGQSHHLGYFACPEEAHAAYLDAKRRLHEYCTI